MTPGPPPYTLKNGNNERSLDDKEKTKLREILGQLNWLACMTRPEISFDVSEISSRVSIATFHDLKKVNKIIKFLKTTPNNITILQLIYLNVILQLLVTPVLQISMMAEVRVETSFFLPMMTETPQSLRGRRHASREW